MKPGALCDLVGDLLVGSERDADNLGGLRRELGEHGPVGRVMAGRKHFLDIERTRDAPVQRAAVDGAQGLLIGAKDDDRLNAQRIVDVAGGIAVRFADHSRRLRDDAARQEGRDVELLPAGKVLAQDDDDLGIEHE